MSVQAYALCDGTQSPTSTVTVFPCMSCASCLVTGLSYCLIDPLRLECESCVPGCWNNQILQYCLCLGSVLQAHTELAA